MQEKVTRVNIHASTQEEEVMGNFYENLEIATNSIPKSHVKVVLGDANAKVGNEEIYKTITGVVAQIIIEKPKVSLEKQERRQRRYDMKELPTKIFHEDTEKKYANAVECRVKRQGDEIE
ncbi:hypothetical protein ILUMI_25749 [Ignelater luminosus]|uniref:Uncharacterized protein n=1 Tax=Ignelater luminosus TaxID=2038154 RepID=A0A8K0C4G6_IGNLU|nr:hypothetical protein ILUMI_25749 [Ignelater luminosus]